MLSASPHHQGATNFPEPCNDHCGWKTLSETQTSDGGTTLDLPSAG